MSLPSGGGSVDDAFSGPSRRPSPTPRRPSPTPRRPIAQQEVDENGYSYPEPPKELQLTIERRPRPTTTARPQGHHSIGKICQLFGFEAVAKDSLISRIDKLAPCKFNCVNDISYLCSVSAGAVCFEAPGFVRWNINRKQHSRNGLYGLQPW